MATGPWAKSAGELFKSVRQDGLANLFTGLGVMGRDKRLGAYYRADTYTQNELEIAYQNDDVAARICDAIPSEMLREGFEVNIEDDPEGGKAVDAWVEDTKVVQSVTRFFQWDRAYGGAGILLGLDDGRSLDQPLNENAIRSFDWMRVLTPDELVPVLWENKIGKTFGEPTVFRYHPANPPPGMSIAQYPLIHRSRLVLLTGVKVSNRNVEHRQFFGDSVLQRCLQVVKDFQAGWAGAFVQMQGYSTRIWKMKGLSKLIEANGREALRDRLEAAEMARGAINAILLDGDVDDFEVLSAPLQGLADLLDKADARLSLASETPISILMGRAPGGLNGGASGQSDMQMFYDRVSSHQTLRALPVLKEILRYAFLAKSGPTNGALPENWSVVFGSLYQPSEKEQAETRKLNSEADTLDITSGVLARSEVRESRYGGARYGTLIKIDKSASAELNAADDLAAADAAEAAAAQPPSDSPPGGTSQSGTSPKK